MATESAMIQRKLKVLIWGSCVSRDIFSATDTSDFELTDYYARSSFCSVTSEPFFGAFPYENIASSFQRKMVQRDLEKTFFREMEKLDVDLVIIDLIDERFDLIEIAPEALVTQSSEFLAAKYTPHEHNALGLIKSGSDRFLDKWYESARVFFDYLHTLDKKPLILLNKVFWGITFEDGRPIGHGHKPEKIAATNNILADYYNFIQSNWPVHVIDGGPTLQVASLHHKWGVAPFHYIQEHYEQAIAQIRKHCRFNGLPRAKDLPVSKDGVWFDNSGISQRVQIQVKLRCDGPLEKKRALIHFRFQIPETQSELKVPGLAKSNNPHVGWYMYLDTDAALTRTNCTFDLPGAWTLEKFGISMWQSNDRILIDECTVFNDDGSKAVLVG